MGEERGKGKGRERERERERERGGGGGREQPKCLQITVDSHDEVIAMLSCSLKEIHMALVCRSAKESHKKQSNPRKQKGAQRG